MEDKINIEVYLLFLVICILLLGIGGALYLKQNTQAEELKTEKEMNQLRYLHDKCINDNTPVTCNEYKEYVKEHGYNLQCQNAQSYEELKSCTYLYKKINQ